MHSTITPPGRGSRLTRLLLIALGVVLASYTILALIPMGRTNPPVISEPNWDSPRTRELAQRACFDCHSNQTVWPWYSYLPPVSWMVIRDVQQGRQHLNFSDWANVRGEGRSAGEMAESILEGAMPPASYLSIHPAARLSAAEREQLIAGLRATVQASGGSIGEGEEEEEGEEEGDDD